MKSDTNKSIDQEIKQEINEAIEKKYKRRKFLENALFTIFVIVFFIVMQFYSPIKAVGESMLPTIQDETYHIYKRKIDEFKYDDIVVVKTDQLMTIAGKSIPHSNVKIIKRVVGLPGDTLVIKDGILYINDIPEDRSFDLIEDPGIAATPITLGENEYFCMGDNRNHSSDSRTYGTFTKEQLLGVIIKKLF